MKRETGSGEILGMLLACLFLFDPIIAFRDYLPDLIGYLLLFFSLSRLADLNDVFAESRRRAGRLIPVGALQLMGALLIYRLLPSMEEGMNAYESPTVLLLCTLLLGLSKLWLLLPALRGLWRGFGACALRTEGSSFDTQRRGRSLSERMSRCTTVFVLLSSVLPLLPELTLLATFDYHSAGKTEYPDWYTGGGAQGMDLYPYVDLFRFFVGAILLLVGLLWLILSLRALLAVRRDEELCRSLDERYAHEILPQTGMLKLRRFRTAFRCLKLGAVFSILLPIYFRAEFSDGMEGLEMEEVLSRGLKSHSYDLLPGLLCALLLLVGVLLLGDLLQKKRGFLLFSVLPIGVSAARLLCNARYMSRFYLKDALYDAEAYDAFLLLRVLQIAEAILLALLLLWVLLLLWRTVKAHTAVIYEGERARALSDRATAALHGKFKRKLLLSAAAFTLAAIAASVFLWLQLQISGLWILATLLGVLAAGLFFSLLNELFEQLTATYAREGMHNEPR